MRHLLPPRWRAPAVLIVAALVALVFGGAEHGWSTLPEILPIPVAVGVFLFVMAGRDSDYGATLRRQLDERQALQRLKIQALVGRVLSIAVVIAYFVAVSDKATLWPWAVMVAVMAVCFITGRLVYDEHGSGSGEDTSSG
jgi:uncharacterized membrane protein